MRPLLRASCRAAALAAALTPFLHLGACAPAASGPRVDVPTPERVDLTALEARLEPAQGQKGILLHFWATW